MYVDPTGHFSIAGILISLGLSISFEFIGDLIDGNGIDHSLREYIGTGISGLFGGLDGGKIPQLIFSIAGGIADSWISGELSRENFGKTILSIGLSITLSTIASKVSTKLVSNFKGKSLTKLGRQEIKNNMKKMGLKYSLSKNGTSAKAIINFLADDNNNWLGKTIADYGSSGIISGLSEFLPI